MPILRTSQKADLFQESVIREMTRLLLHWEQETAQRGVNLAQGFPDFAAPDVLKEAACDAIRSDINQYAVTWGAPALREAIAAKTARFYGTAPDPLREITVTCGATEAMIAAFLAVTDPGDEVILFEPFYENYGPDAILSGTTPVFVRLNAPDWTFDPEALRRAFTNRTRAIVINTPHNPTGKVFTHEELSLIAELCQQWNVCAITDEIYEHLVYDGATHLRIADLPGMAERTITISGLSKTYSATGWRIGWLIAPPEVTVAIRKVHDFLTVGAAAPLQAGAAFAINQLPESYYTDLADTYRAKRDTLLSALKDTALGEMAVPQGAYYILTDSTALQQITGQPSDSALARHLITTYGLATVPGSSFFREAEGILSLLRFCYCKKPETLARAADLLRALPR